MPPAVVSVMAGAMKLFAIYLFVIDNSEQKLPTPMMSFHCLSEVWILVCLSSEAIGLGIRDE
jgi:hypothetical protein